MSAFKYLGLLGGLGGGLATGAIGKHGINPAWLGISPMGSAMGLFGDEGQAPYKWLGKNMMRGGMFGAGMGGQQGGMSPFMMGGGFMGGGMGGMGGY